MLLTIIGGVTMRIGIISDTHDNLRAVSLAVDIFNEKSVEAVLHAGDWCAPFTMVNLAKVNCKVYGVFGNVDGEREHMRVKARHVGVELLGDFGELEFNGVRIALIHGKIERIVEALVKSGLYHVVVRGHTHRAEVKRVNNCLLINPGEACGYVTGRKSIAILDVETMDVEILDLP